MTRSFMCFPLFCLFRMTFYSVPEFKSLIIRRHVFLNGMASPGLAVTIK
jgi:hypothetical protein